MSDLLSALEGVLEFYRRAPRAWPAQMGNGRGVVAVPNKPGYAYVRMPDGQTAEAYNARLPFDNDLTVKVGYDDFNPLLFQVLEFRHVYNDQLPTTVQQHHETHEFLNALGGTDVVFNDIRQVTHLAVYPASGLVVSVYGGTVWTATGYKFVSGSIDLTSYVPVSGAVLVVIALDMLGVITVLDGGSNPGSRTYLSLLDCPPVPLGYRPLAAVALETGQTDIVETRARRDIIDLRLAMSSASADTLWNFHHYI